MVIPLMLGENECEAYVANHHAQFETCMPHVVGLSSEFDFWQANEAV